MCTDDLALGTGIGVSLLLDGSFYSGSKGLVEGGHMVQLTELKMPASCTHIFFLIVLIQIIDSSKNARKCGCGQVGCAEAYASASKYVP